jgi:hypothetical protein
LRPSPYDGSLEVTETTIGLERRVSAATLDDFVATRAAR